MRISSVAAGAVIVVLAGCSTAPVVPDVALFGETVTKIGEADAKSAAAKSLPSRVAAARRADFAANDVFYQTSDRADCNYTDERLVLVAGRFSERCKLVPVMLVGDDVIVAASQYDSFADQEAAGRVVGAGNQTLLSEHLGYGIRSDLIAYSKALSELATTDDPAKLGASTGAAFDALTGLKDTVSAAASKDGKAAPASDLRAPSKTFFSVLATEVAETMRYRRLRAIVEYADPFVQQSAVQLSVLTFESERAAIDPKAEALLRAVDDTEAGNPASLKAAEDARAEMIDIDEKAKFGRYAGIGRAHAAILAALNEPADFDRLADANTRIVALAEAIRDFAEEL